MCLRFLYTDLFGKAGDSMANTDWLEVGKIVNTHGLRGEVKIVPWTDSPDVFEDIPYVYIKKKTGEIKLTVKNVKYQKNNIIVKFAEINSIEEAEVYKNFVLYAEREVMPDLPDGAFYITDLIGLEVYEETDNRLLGTIQDVYSTGSSDIYEVKRENNHPLLIPVIDDVVKDIDLENKKVTVKLLEGLEEL